MGLFKNEVGRPSNETLKKRRIIYAIAGVSLACLVGVGVFFIFGGSNEIGGKSKNAAMTSCVQPYTVSLCKSEGSINGTQAATIKKLQQMLKDAGFYKGSDTGNYDTATESAVKAAQKNYGLSQTGKADAALVSKMADKYGYGYTTITFNNNGGSGSMSPQFIMRADIPIRASGFSKSGYKHVGYTAEATGRWNNTKYYYGCVSNTNCTYYNMTMVTEAQKNSYGSKFTQAVIASGTTVHSDKFNFLTGVTVVFKAVYNKTTTTGNQKPTFITTPQCSSQKLVISVADPDGQIKEIKSNGKSVYPNAQTITSQTYDFGYERGKEYGVTVYDNAGESIYSTVKCLANQAPVIKSLSCSGQLLKIEATDLDGGIRQIKSSNNQSKYFPTPLKTVNASYDLVLQKGKTYNIVVVDNEGKSTAKTVTCVNQAPVIKSISCSGQLLNISATDSDGGIRQINASNGQSKYFPNPQKTINAKYDLVLKKGKTYNIVVIDNDGKSTAKTVKCS